jgi:hypothetical protein
LCLLYYKLEKNSVIVYVYFPNMFFPTLHTSLVLCSSIANTDMLFAKLIVIQILHCTDPEIICIYVVKYSLRL